MKKFLIIVAILVVAFVFYQNRSIEVNDFISCAEINPVMESYPRQCAHEGVTYVEDISIKCTKEQRGAQVCTMDYTPVCATVNIQCITEPCESIQEIFGNACTACSNSLVESYVPGECF